MAEGVNEQQVVDITKSVLERMGYSGALVEVFVDDTERLQVRVRIKEEVGMLIGKGGETVRALQHLLLLIVSKQTDTHFKPGGFVFDVNDYLKDREQYLVSLAKATADEVRQSHLPKELMVMPASERRIIHVTLSEEQGVQTESVGKKGERCVVVKPL